MSESDEIEELLDQLCDEEGLGLERGAETPMVKRLRKAIRIAREPLLKRIDELLVTVRNISQEPPLPDEARELRKSNS